MIGWLAVGCTSTAKPQASRRCVRNATWSAMPSPVRLTEAMRTDSSSVRTSDSERSRTAASIMASPGAPPGESGEFALQLLVAFLHRIGHALAQLAFDELAVELHLVAPLRALHGGRGGELLVAEIEPAHVEGLGHVSQRRGTGTRLALDALDDPL